MTTEYECAECLEIFSSQETFVRHAKHKHRDKSKILYNVLRNGRYSGRQRLLNTKD